MSTTPSCQTCAGGGWVCSGCRRPNRRPGSSNRRDFGKGCACRARSVRCPSHVERVTTCDTCLVRMLAGVEPVFHNGRAVIKGVDLCHACAERLGSRIAVVVDEFLSKGPT